ncbi:hypothetical protein CROQUDRAFT_50955, partial [Cronartium quercuum f. sp. fusiforme G11]
IIQEKWAHFAHILKIPSSQWIRGSNGWMAKFKAKLGIWTFVQHGEAASVDEKMVTAEWKCLTMLCKSYHPKDVFNMDERGLIPPDCALANAIAHGLKSSKNRLTFALTCNALGTEKLEPLIIGRYQRLHCFKRRSGSELGLLYFFNTKAWMNHMIFQDWIAKLNLKCVAKQRHILLLLDNFTGHLLPPAPLTNVRVEFFHPNMTSHLQPLNSGIIQDFKSNFKT